MNNLDRTFFSHSNFKHKNYQITQLLGHGGFCKVYKAEQLSTGKVVAIKILELDCSKNAAIRQCQIDRFDRETSLCAKLHHPNIVNLLDKGQVSNALFATYDYVPGVTLKEEIAQSGALLATDAAELMGQILDALACAHSLGIVHRDLKPENIMITTTGAKKQVKLLDFGIAAFTVNMQCEKYKDLTLTNEIIGTPTYSAPEQLRGAPPNCKTDLYAWGLLYIECLTGEKAITGGSLATVFAKQLSPASITLPAALAGHPLSDLLRRVLKKNISERAGDAIETYRVLKSINMIPIIGTLSAFNSYRCQTILHNDNDNLKTQITTNPLIDANHLQRKQISSLCVSLRVSPSTPIRTTTEALDAILTDQKSQCTDVAIRYGGFCAGNLGDTLLFHFGHPLASDSDSRLCARTALDIMGLLRKRNQNIRVSRGIKVQAHMGIHTGLVTISPDFIPEGTTPNTAMALSRLSSSNQILCSLESYQLLKNHIELKPYDSPEAYKIGNGNALYAFKRERQIEACCLLSDTESTRRLVGRDRELKYLLQLVKGSNKQRVAYIHGEAGIGKSRLMFEFRKRTKIADHLVFQCLPENKHTSLFPILNLLKQKYSLSTQNSGTIYSTFLALLRGQLCKDEINISLAILFSWLGVTLKTEIETPTLSADTQKEKLFQVLAFLIYPPKTSTELFCLISIEDTHWADPTTIEFINFLCKWPEFIVNKDVLLCSSRQKNSENIGVLNTNKIEIKKLDYKNSVQLLQQLFCGQTLSKNLVATIIDRTDGIPLFIEELATMIKQKNMVHQVNGEVDFISHDKLTDIPSTLRDSLQQRLDDLAHGKDCAQIAATIGRNFDYSLLSDLYHHDQEYLNTGLKELVESGLIFLQRSVDGDTYSFKHALIRDVAYDSMTCSFRSLAHSSVAEKIECSSKPYSSETLELLSYHFGKSNAPDKCALYSNKAARDATPKSAYTQ